MQTLTRFFGKWHKATPAPAMVPGKTKTSYCFMTVAGDPTDLQSEGPQLPSKPTEAELAELEEVIDFAQMKDEDLEEIKEWLKQKEVDLAHPHPEPNYMLEWQGSRFMPTGNLISVSSQKKCGKTTFLTMLSAAILEPESENIKKFLPGLTCNEETKQKMGRKPKVVYIDTEQEASDTDYIYKAVAFLCGWSLHENNERFHVYPIRTTKRKVKTTIARRQAIVAALETYHPDVLIVDGIGDIVSGVNDEEEAYATLDWLATLSSHYNVSIPCVLHENPKDSQTARTATKARGHLGTALGNKTFGTLRPFKRGKGDNAVFTVEFLDNRHKDIDNMKFHIVELEHEGEKLHIPQIITGKEPGLTDINEANVKRWIMDFCKVDGNQDLFPMTKKGAKERIFRNSAGLKGSDILQEAVDFAVKRKLLVKEKNDDRYPKLILSEKLKAELEAQA